ncbi:hypothetical protein YC2023_043585 [Brassica napus]
MVGLIADYPINFKDAPYCTTRISWSGHVLRSSPARNTCHKAATTLLKPPLEGTCRKIRSPPLFTDMQDAAETLNSIHRKHTGKQGAEIRHHTSDGEDLPP